ncbi:hypothetical protein [Caldithrix abyssi]
MTKEFKALIENVKKVKKQGLLTDKFKVYVAGWMQGLLMEDLITLKEADEFMKLAEIDGNFIEGIAQLAGYGDNEDEDSPIEFK